MRKALFSRRCVAGDFQSNPPRSVRQVRAGNSWVCVDAETLRPCPDLSAFCGNLVVTVDFLTSQVSAELVRPQWSRESGDWDERSPISMEDARRLGWDGQIPTEEITTWQAEQAAKVERAQSREEWIASLPKTVGEFSVSSRGIEDRWGNWLMPLPQNQLTPEQLLERVQSRLHVE